MEQTPQRIITASFFLSEIHLVVNFLRAKQSYVFYFVEYDILVVIFKAIFLLLF